MLCDCISYNADKQAIRIQVINLSFIHLHTTWNHIKTSFLKCKEKMLTILFCHNDTILFTNIKRHMYIYNFLFFFQNYICVFVTPFGQ